MTLPAYADWKEAQPLLHQAAQVLNAVRLASLPPMPNALRHSLRPIAVGATTDRLPFGGTLTLDYVQGAIIYMQGGAESFRVSLQDHTQQALLNSVVAGIAQAGHPLDTERTPLAGTTPLNPDLTQTQLYAGVQWRMFRMLALVKAHMFGGQNPLVLWPHGFDLSTLWFAAGLDEQNDPHLNLGFSPGTADIGQPYVYFYTHPALSALPDKLPDLITWTRWKVPGGYIRYDQFAHESDPEQMLADVLLEVYRVASDMLMVMAEE